MSLVPIGTNTTFGSDFTVFARRLYVPYGAGLGGIDDMIRQNLLFLSKSKPSGRSVGFCGGSDVLRGDLSDEEFVYLSG
jgi:hypothetical protein